MGSSGAPGLGLLWARHLKPQNDAPFCWAPYYEDEGNEALGRFRRDEHRVMQDVNTKSSRSIQQVALCSGNPKRSLKNRAILLPRTIPRPASFDSINLRSHAGR